ncbi:hypothetical protein KCP76_12890 [Salmonella enterica subsp. enterica serovar Weltevreden]|nr:hypothetical protein KCP76_12890 [Salmonella enterica subsp. enterica serovar Weltevreden]
MTNCGACGNPEDENQRLKKLVVELSSTRRCYRRYWKPVLEVGSEAPCGDILRRLTVSASGGDAAAMQSRNRLPLAEPA